MYSRLLEAKVFTQWQVFIRGERAANRRKRRWGSEVVEERQANVEVVTRSYRRYYSYFKHLHAYYSRCLISEAEGSRGKIPRNWVNPWLFFNLFLPHTGCYSCINTFINGTGKRNRVCRLSGTYVVWVNRSLSCPDAKSPLLIVDEIKTKQTNKQKHSVVSFRPLFKAECCVVKIPLIHFGG